MNGDRKILEKIVSHVLSGKGAHAEAESVFEGLDWKLTGIHQDGAEHSIFQLLNHMIYWQEWVMKWLDGEEAAIPERAAGSWPGSLAPANQEDWERAVGRFKAGVDELTAQSREGDIFSLRLSVATEKSRLEMIHTIGSHNSYHLGQVVILRQMLGAWPPPSGGLTW